MLLRLIWTACRLDARQTTDVRSARAVAPSCVARFKRLIVIAAVTSAGLVSIAGGASAALRHRTANLSGSVSFTSKFVTKGKVSHRPGIETATQPRQVLSAGRGDDLASTSKGAAVRQYDAHQLLRVSRTVVATNTGAAGEATVVGKPSGTPDFTDPATSPGKGWEWRGNGDPASGKGAWTNPATGESLHPDLGHAAGGSVEGPHYDWKDPSGTWHRVYPDGRVLPKKP